MLKPNRRTLITMALTLAASAGFAPLAQAGNSLPASAPMRIGRVGLRARDAEALARWYETTLGLRRLPGAPEEITLGVDAPLLVIREERGLAAYSPASAGLYHTAFLLPDRLSLARWIMMAIDRRVPVDGVADHAVSEAIYLTDPEGNGVEIYCDRPEKSWQWTGSQVEMGTEALDVEGLIALVGLGADLWQGAPAGTIVGHVHMKVGDAPAAAAWWQTTGFEVVRKGSGAVFLSTGHYHHHIAVNEWQSSGAKARPRKEAGLDHVEILSSLHKAPEMLDDPWGTEIRLIPA